MAIDESKIVDAVVSMNPHGNEEGIIDAFGVYLTNHYADYYNRVSYVFERAIKEYNPDYLEFLRSLLVMSGHVCGYYTFGGIRRSKEWSALIAPMCESKEDEIRGLVATLNALGWGVWQVVAANPDELIIKSANTYESTGHLRDYGKRESPGCFLALGVAIAFMNIIYGTENIKPDDMSTSAFYGEEVMCRSKGEPYCEFVVKRRR